MVERGTSGALAGGPRGGPESRTTMLQAEGYDTVPGTHRLEGAESYLMTVSASPDSSSCGTWPKAYVASAVSVNVQITS